MSARGGAPALAWVLACALAAAVPRAASAQSLATRLATAPDGRVRVTYATRPDACGDGRDVVAVRDVLTTSHSVQIRGWSNVPCAHGPARLVLTVQRGAVADLRVHVGPTRAEPADVRDWGTIRAADAAELALTLAGRLTGRAAQRAVVAAAVADSADVWRRLLALARGSAAEERTRRTAMHWLGAVAPPEAVAPLTAIARDAGETRTVREGALAVLALAPDAAGVPVLIGLTRGGGEAWLREKAIFWLGQADDGASRRRLLDLAASDGEPVEVRKKALLWAGQRADVPVAELVAVYPGLTGTELRKHYAFVLSQRDEDAAVDALVDVARRDADQAVRRQALFWLGQSRSPRAHRYLVEVIDR